MYNLKLNCNYIIPTTINAGNNNQYWAFATMTQYHQTNLSLLFHCLFHFIFSVLLILIQILLIYWKNGFPYSAIVMNSHKITALWSNPASVFEKYFGDRHPHIHRRTKANHSSYTTKWAKPVITCGAYAGNPLGKFEAKGGGGGGGCACDNCGTTAPMLTALFRATEDAIWDDDIDDRPCKTFSFALTSCKTKLYSHL